MKEKKKSLKNWSGRVTKFSNALDLEGGVFTWKDPHKIAVSLGQVLIVPLPQKRYNI